MPRPRAAAVRLPDAFRGDQPPRRWSRTAWSTTGGAGTCVAWDLDRDDWRTFRVDRIEPRTPTGPRFTPRPLPPDDEIAAQVARGVGEATWRYRATGDRARARRLRAGPAADRRCEVEALGEDRCAFEPGSDSPEMLALYLGMLDADFEIVDAPELVEALRGVAARYQRAVEASTTS